MTPDPTLPSSQETKILGEESVMSEITRSEASERSVAQTEGADSAGDRNPSTDALVTAGETAIYCPHCAQAETSIEENGKGAVWVWCGNCAARGPVARSAEQAVEYWNRRLLIGQHASVYSQLIQDMRITGAAYLKAYADGTIERVAPERTRAEA